MHSDERDIFSIGIDLGGTNLRVGAYTSADGLLETISRPTRLNAGRDAVVSDMCDAIRQLRGKYSPAKRLAGVGLGTPGPLEMPAGRLHNLPNLPGWDGFYLKAAVEDRLGSPILIESDANAAALAECYLGRGRSLHVDSLCMLTLGTGVGNAILLNGKVWHGVTGMAGEAGHATVYPDGPSCACGSHGCLELYASATALARMARERMPQPAAGAEAWTARTLAEAARNGNPSARQIFDSAGTALGIELAALVNILNLPLYVVGGGVAAAWDLLSPSLFSELRHRSYVYRLTEPGGPAASSIPNGGTQIAAAELGSDAGLLGACLLPLRE